MRIQGVIQNARIYDLSGKYPEVSLTQGFQITSVAEYGNFQARIDLENSVWRATLDDVWFREKISAPSYSSNWDSMVISPDGKPVAASLIWVHPKNQTAEIDPLGTHPAYRKRGFARALVIESFRRMYTSKICFTLLLMLKIRSSAICIHHCNPLKHIRGFSG